jgi:uncharacterized protein YqgC (DUF456 family)
MAVDWQSIGEFSIYAVATIICLAGIVLSCLSLSGTWLVLAATGLMTWIRWPAFPNIGTLLTFLLLCIGVEVLEAVAGAWGVQKRGGSKAAGWAALGGGFIGMILGGMIMPVIGNLVGMLMCSFGLAFWVEHARMKKADHAAHVAFGAVLARLGVIFIKVGVTLAMTAFLIIGFAAG